MKLTEIARIKPDKYTGDKKSLNLPSSKNRADVKLFKTAKALPGGSGYTWAVKLVSNHEKIIYIFDPDMPRKLLEPGELPAIGALKLMFGPGFHIVSTISVLPEYRGKRIGLALYGIVLDILKLTLTAGATQTPSGRKMWNTIISIPGVQVYAVISKDIEKFDLDDLTEAGSKLFFKPRSEKSSYQETFNEFIKEIGGESLNSQQFIIPVEAGEGEVKNKYINVYTDSDEYAKASRIQLVARKP